MSRISARSTLAVVALVLTIGAATISPAAAISSSSYEHQVHVATNRVRTSHGLVKLHNTSCVDRYAERQARWMARHRTLQHQSLRRIMKACKLRGAAENIAEGFSSGNRVVAAWMDSPGHRHNILTAKMRLIGIGAVRDSHGRWWVSQVFGVRR